MGDCGHGGASFGRWLGALAWELYATIYRAAEGFWRYRHPPVDATMLTVSSQRCGMAEKKGLKPSNLEEDADG
jgi:hypothetical protein